MKFSIIILGAMLFGVIGCKSSQPAPQSSASPAPSAALVTVDPAAAGSVSGAISFQGSTARWPAIDMSQDPGCPTQPQAAEAVVIDNGKLADVFVYIKDGLPPGRFAAPAEPVVLDQRGCRYLPHVVGVMAGQPLKIMNSDNAEHNVHPMPTKNDEWNESQMPKSPPIVKTFGRPEMMMAVRCNQHPWMQAYINVMAHPYYAVSAMDGTFTIKNLPPGEYTLAAVHEKFGEQTMQVKVTPKAAATADFTFRPRQ